LIQSDQSLLKFLHTNRCDKPARQIGYRNHSFKLPPFKGTMTTLFSGAQTTNLYYTFYTYLHIKQRVGHIYTSSPNIIIPNTPTKKGQKACHLTQRTPPPPHSHPLAKIPSTTQPIITVLMPFGNYEWVTLQIYTHQVVKEELLTLYISGVLSSPLHR